MSGKFKKIGSRLRAVVSVLFLTLLSIVSWAQTPTHIPRESSEPVNFFESAENIIFFVVIPLLIVVFYLIWRRNLRKQKEEQEKNNKG